MVEAKGEKSSGSRSRGRIAETVGGVVAATVAAPVVAYAYGKTKFDDAAIVHAREEIERKLQEEEGLAARVQQEFREKYPISSESELKERFIKNGDGEKIAAIRARGEYARNIEKMEQDAQKYISESRQRLAAELEPRLNQLEANAARWKDASRLGKPWIAFKAAPASIKVGVIASAAALGLGAAWAVGKWRNNGPEKKFTERLENERSSADHSLAR